MGKLILVTLTLAIVFGAVKSFEITEKDLASEESLWDLYERWRSHHTISRDLTEKKQRFNVFKENVKHIHKVNQMDKPYKLKLNKYADMTNHEFRSGYSSKIKHYRMFQGEKDKTSGFMHDKTNNLPPAIDWRKNGAVTPENDENAMMKAVANQPISVGIDAGGPDMQFYSEGVYTGPCGTELDHGVAVVGYGTTLDGTKYWTVKNSWGQDWGEQGYIRFQRMVDEPEGLCGIAMEPSYPVKNSSTNPPRPPRKDEL